MFCNVSHVYTPRFMVIKCLLVFCVITLAASASLRILGGRDAHENELPYVVRLEVNVVINIYGKRNMSIFLHACTCTALTPVWTLTAQHCIEITNNKTSNLAKSGKLISNLKVLSTINIIRYGSPTGSPLHSSTSEVKKINIPVRRRNSITENDVMLLKTEPIKLSKYGKLSALDNVALLYQEVTIVGYGITNYTDQKTSEPLLGSTLDAIKALQVAKGMLVKCEHVYPYICVNSACGRYTTACPGDSGSPVIHRSGIMAITSRALMYNCQMQYDIFRSPTISVVVPISPYLDWISDVIGKK